MSAGEWGWEISMVINKEIRYTYSTYIHKYNTVYNVMHLINVTVLTNVKVTYLIYLRFGINVLEMRRFRIALFTAIQDM
jgi:hypothetical protein